MVEYVESFIVNTINLPFITLLRDKININIGSDISEKNFRKILLLIYFQIFQYKMENKKNLFLALELKSNLINDLLKTSDHKKMSLFFM